MKLYYAQATCSHAPHIALREAGLPFDLVKFDMKARTVEGGAPLEEVNDKGYVPVLELSDGQRITEVAVILQYIADQAPQTGLAPRFGTLERYRLMEWLNFIGTEVHKAHWPLFHDGAEVENTKAREKLGRAYALIEKRLGRGPWLMGDQFTVADAYLITVLNWARAGNVEIPAALKEYRDRGRKRPAVQAAMEAEGMLRRAG
ncbi:MAG TPA: glutathione S-transferase C-terminal domain-containing protein [Myxococcales bacterium]|jgi:glutathione S-transferase|nr:glutathione S-transferase C-terminal domain-containing protein [Myxococcales bacterium]